MLNPIFSKFQGQKHPGRWGIVEHQIPSCCLKQIPKVTSILVLDFYQRAGWTMWFSDIYSNVANHYDAKVITYCRWSRHTIGIICENIPRKTVFKLKQDPVHISVQQKGSRRLCSSCSSISFSQIASHLHIYNTHYNNVCSDGKTLNHSLLSCLQWYKWYNHDCTRWCG